MAKNSANEAALGTLHAKVAQVFQQVLETYEKRLAIANTVGNTEELSETMLSALLDANLEPNPAMMGAITKFLKDNSIAFDTEEVTALADTELRLAQRRKQREADRPDDPESRRWLIGPSVRASDGLNSSCSKRSIPSSARSSST